MYYFLIKVSHICIQADETTRAFSNPGLGDPQVVHASASFQLHELSGSPQGLGWEH